MVDHQLGGLQGVDLLRLTTHGDHRIAHGGQVHDRGNSGEILEQDARRHEGDLLRRGRLRIPAENRLDIFTAHGLTVLSA